MKVVSLVASALLATVTFAASAMNERPSRPVGPASELVADCQVTVRFNEDEKSVKESEYAGSFFCLGVIQGVFGVNDYLERPLFCLPPEGLKHWLGAKVVVEYAKQYPYKLTLPATEFVLQALKESFPCDH